MRPQKERSAPPRLGQHFLKDGRVRDRIISDLCLQGDDEVLEIGAGRGFLTVALAQRARKLWAIELDARCVQALKVAFLHSKKVNVLEADILKVDLKALCGGSPPHRLRIVGNLPYYITSPILFRLFEQADVIRDATLMVQREVAERITAPPTSKQYGYASLATQLFSHAQLCFSIPPSAFSPPPRVHSSVVHLQISPRAAELRLDDVSGFLQFAQGIFQEKRKTLFNNLKRMIPWAAPSARHRLLEALSEGGLNSTVRAENLSLEQTAQLYRRLRHLGWL